ncbi:MAG: hypothetical protein HYY17_06005 [Planctomycetes bacterium]|nr:hypothetical protein [Planctomycetota bacterium]
MVGPVQGGAGGLFGIGGSLRQPIVDSAQRAERQFAAGASSGVSATVPTRETAAAGVRGMSSLLGVAPADGHGFQTQGRQAAELLQSPQSSGLGQLIDIVA